MRVTCPGAVLQDSAVYDTFDYFVDSPVLRITLVVYFIPKPQWSSKYTHGLPWTPMNLGGDPLVAGTT